MKIRYILIILHLFILKLNNGLSQDTPALDLSLIKRENIEFEALKPFFYILRQDYVVVSDEGERIKLGGNNYFGKSTCIGVLTKDRKIWFPGFIREPWTTDNNFQEYKNTHTPECTYIHIKNIGDTAYQVFEYHEFDTKKGVISVPFGRFGIPISQELLTSGSLIIFHSRSLTPESFENISYSIIYLNDIEWKNNEIINLHVPYLGNEKIIGGALFERIIQKGLIEWKLSGIYFPSNEKWTVKLLR